MDQPTPDKGRHHELREALKRDAARLPQPSFDVALHASVMRRVRAIRQEKPAVTIFPPWLLPLGAGTAAALVLGMFALRWLVIEAVFELSAPLKSHPGAVALQEPSLMAPSSAWDYRRAAARNDGTLVAMLDRDTCRLLPPSPAVFSKIPAAEESTTP